MSRGLVLRLLMMGVVFPAVLFFSDQAIAANQPPLASFSGGPTISPTPALVIFNASASSDPDGSIVSYAWDFGDGQTGAGVSLSHEYVTAGTYFPVLTVTDNDGLTATYSTAITMLPTPPSVLSAGAAADVAGNTVTVPIILNPNPAYNFAALQFDLVLPSSLTATAITAGPTAGSAGKIVSANLAVPPRGIVFGFNSNVIAPGVIAYVQLLISNTASPGPLSVGITNVQGADPAGLVQPVGSVQGGTVTVVASGSPVITSTTSDAGVVGQAYTYSITGTNSPTTFNATGLPAGLAINTGTGQITGTPTVAGASIITLSAMNGSGTGTGTLALTITAAAGAPVIQGPGVYQATENIDYEPLFTSTATNNPTSFGLVGSLPTGFTFDTTSGTISGTPTVTGVFSLTQQATNASGTGTAPLILIVVPAVPQITSALVSTGMLGQSFTYAITASNSPSLFNAVGLPTGLSINTTTGLISGTPLAVGVFNVSLSALNLGGAGSVSLLNLTISTNRPVITSPATDNATVGQAYTYQITASNSPTGFIASGLPGGLSVDTTTGLISGTPTTGGVFSINLSAVNGFGTGPVTGLSLTVAGSGSASSFAPRVYPSPWRSDQDSDVPITFDQLAGHSTIKIFTTSGHQVKDWSTDNTSTTWNRENNSGDTVASGLYFYVITNNLGQKATGKFVIIK